MGAEVKRNFLVLRRSHMKKLIPLMLGLGLAIGSVTVCFAQDTTTTPTKKKGKKKKADTTKKD